MSSQKELCCTNAADEDIYLFTLRNANGTEVLVTNYGAIITSFRVKGNSGTNNDIVLGFDSVEQYWSEEYLKNYPYFGAAIGRYGNRIKDAAFTIDGKRYQLTKNDGSNQLHGGLMGFDRKVWKLLSFETGEKPSLELIYHSADGEEGFPGNLQSIIRFELTANDELIHRFMATTDAPSAVNLTHHSYFNLDNGETDIREHQLMINAHSILEQDRGLVATGEMKPVAGAKYDFRKPVLIRDRIDSSGFDQSFCIDRQRNGLELAAEVFSGASKLKMQVWTTAPIVHFYSGHGLSEMIGKNGKTYRGYSGFCLETQIHPNAIKIPHFPNTVLRPGEKYFHETVYKIIKT